MKRTNKSSWLFAFLIFCITSQTAFAQTKEDVTNGTAEITWLGLDFTQAKFIGDATQFKDAGEISPAEMRDKYFNGWNQLFINEAKKYDVAKPAHRTEVKYAIDVAGKTNDAIQGGIVSQNPADYGKLDSAKVVGLVKNYDFQGKTGVGLIIFIDGMSKGKEEASGWIAYVDMKAKKVLMTSHQTGKPGGFGFKNYWAKAFLTILKGADYTKWKK